MNGTTREYYLNLPSGYDGKKPVPVVWEYHPLGGNAKQGLTMYQLNNKLTNVLFVSPQGLTSGGNAGFPNTDGQDEAMTRAINAVIEAKYCVGQGTLLRHRVQLWRVDVVHSRLQHERRVSRDRRHVGRPDQRRDVHQQEARSPGRRLGHPR